MWKTSCHANQVLKYNAELSYRFCATVRWPLTRPALPWHGVDALFVCRPRPEPNIPPHKKIGGASCPAV